MNDDILIRPATLDDLDALVYLRRLMFESMGHTDPEQLAAGDRAARAYIEAKLPGGEFCAWVAVAADGQVVSSGGAVIDVHPPGPGNLSGKIGYIMSVATRPEYRRRGLARRIVETIIEWFKAQGVTRIALHASDMGRPMYERMGFKASTEMRLEIK
ncbi:MAG: GNAT family N-acetyltransferase [Anaerolineae bacterium]|nr:GNAT family N-acetyltransferase [Anaerolineae bacterium]